MCREEREKLSAQLVELKAGIKTLGQAMTRDSLEQIASVRRDIEQLGRVIAAFAEVPIVPRS